MSTPKTVAFHTLGCKLNFSETSSIRRSFENQGYQTIHFEEGADIYVLNTCSVTDFADKKCRYEVRRALKYSPQAKIVVVGCYAQLKPKEIAEIPGVDLVLGAAEKFNILQYIDGISDAPDKGMVIAGDVKEAKTFISSFSFGDRTRSFLKVQDGCDYKCSFCTIPQARGSSRSDTIENVIKNVEEIASKGVKEIVLTGVNLGDFGNGTEVIEGLRPKKEAMFIDLIRALDEIKEISRYRISSIEPNLCTDEVIEFVASSRAFLPHFHIPLQSGSPKILREMKRRYTVQQYEERIKTIKKWMPHSCIGVDVIVGFPGEGHEEFTETYEFLHRMDVSYFHVFTYSERNNTLASEMKNVVPMEIRRERNESLRILSQKKKNYFVLPFTGQKFPVLWENTNDPSIMSGYTPNFIKVEAPFQENKINTLEEIILDQYNVSEDSFSIAFG
ncbi:MAG: tRNA (N(6)-L-threonylcarbamoyladenosine(37)-C(2))-methylthiotransferase MtaB [Saprospiraceae bacterium]|nr:tRNA (N(6)-L-threonylcarbamoyladenosine(37)-C(2))-methylthiotransferase MtaB [Saprospiraceae bacterium]